LTSHLIAIPIMILILLVMRLGRRTCEQCGGQFHVITFWRLAIRRMSSAGYPWGTVALVELMEQPKNPLRPDAQRALENIAGETHSSEAVPWRQWLASLPVDVIIGDSA